MNSKVTLKEMVATKIIYAMLLVLILLDVGQAGLA